MQAAQNNQQSSQGQAPAWLLDLLLGIAVTLVIALVASADYGGRQPADALAYLLAASFGALMLLRRQFPVVVLISTMFLLFAYYTLGYPSIGLAVPVAAALYSAAERQHMPAAIVVSLILIAVSTYFRLRDGESPVYLFGYELVSTVALLAAAIALGDGTRMRRALRREQAQLALLIEQEHAYRAEQRVQAERLRVARDLHDVIGHSISVISLHADVAREAIGSSDADALRALSHIRAASSESMRELRATVKLLRTPLDVPTEPVTGSLAQLPALAERARASGLQVELRCSVQPDSLPPAVNAAAYRIVQEAVTNVLRHAAASELLISIAQDQQALQLLIIDNGTAPKGPVRWGNGIAGMHERARLLRGQLSAQPRDEGGFVIQASLPLGEAI